MSQLSAKTLKKLFKKQNVVGTYSGEMTKDGKPRGRGVIVTVTRKMKPWTIRKADLVPPELDGIPTDVIEVGEIKPLAIDRTAKHRPFPMGVSIGHPSITAGTAGCIVKRGLDSFVLSNNHVLANVNSGQISDPIYQPGPHDGGDETCVVGDLADYIDIKFPECAISQKICTILNFLTAKFGSSARFSFEYDTFADEVTNLVDCAIAQLHFDVAVPQIADIGMVEGVAIANPGDLVKKSGRTTAVTTAGDVVANDFTVQVNMGPKGIAYFSNQILINTPGFSAGGDSGSLILKEENGKNVAVGLLFAGSDQVTIANRIQNVLTLLNVGV